jgi:hypothetical protein
LHGREQLILEILENSPTSRDTVFVLSGHGGVGKSAIALELASRYSDLGKRTWWINCSDASLMSDIFLDIASRDLGFSEEFIANLKRSPRNIADAFWSGVESTTDWLLVFDNVDDPSQFSSTGLPAANGRGWIRPSNKGTVLITTRVPDREHWGLTAIIHTIGDLTSHDGAKVLLDLAPRAGSLVEAEKLASQLHGLPLALRQAGVYLANPIAAAQTFEEYQLQLNLPPETNIASLADEERARTAVEATWDLSLDLLRRQGLSWSYSPALPQELGYL